MEANAAGMFDWHLGLATQQAGGHGRMAPSLQRQGERAASDKAGQDRG